MDPQLTLSSHANRLVATVKIVTPPGSQAEQIGPDSAKPFPSSGAPGDELLNLAYQRGVVNLEGRVIDDVLFELKENLKEELHAASQFLKTIDKKSHIHSNNVEYYSHFVPFTKFIFGMREILNARMRPEIIGGAVSYLLGEAFYVQYVAKRFHLPLEEAKALIEPFLRLREKVPADIDCRQYITREFSVLDEGFKEKFAKMVAKILIEQTKNPGIDWRIIKNHYFQKLNRVAEEGKRFGMGRLGRFLGGFPLEYFIVQELKQPYISFHKSMALLIDDRLEISLKFYTNKVASANILPETTIFQQGAMILDSDDLSDVDWRGFLSSMAEATRGGYRTLRSGYFDDLWQIFADSQVNLEEKMQWAIENHLHGRGESVDVERELSNSFAFNICLYLMEKQAISEEQVLTLLKACKGLSEPLNYLVRILQIPGMTLTQRLAWFKIGMWIRLSPYVPVGELSTHHGTLCHRMISSASKAVVWMPVDLQKACKIAMASLRENEIGEELFIQMLFLIAPSTSEPQPTPYPLSHFNALMDSSAAKNLAHLLRGYKNSANALKLALQIDLTRCASGVESALSLDWFKVLPEFLHVYPEEYAIFHPLFAKVSADSILIVPKIQTVLFKPDWIAHLIQSENSEWVEMGLTMLKEEKPHPTTNLALETVSLEVLKVRLSLECRLEELSWVLFALALGGGNKSCSVQINKNKELVLTDGQRTLPILRSEFVKEGIDFFERNSERAIALFSQLLPDYAFAQKSIPWDGEAKKLVNQFARKGLRQAIGSPSFMIGLKIFLILVKQAESLPMALELFPLYPGLHAVVPEAGGVIRSVLAKDEGSKRLTSLLSSNRPIELESWIVALLLHPHKECMGRGANLVKGLNAEQKERVWNELYPLLLQHRVKFIPDAIALFEGVSITYEGYSQFFMQWITKVRNPKNEKVNKELQTYLIKNQGEFTKHKLLKNHRGSGLDWLAKAIQVIKEVSEKPEITLIERFRLQLEEVRKKKESLNDEEFTRYFLALEVPPQSRVDYDKIVQSRLPTLRAEPLLRIQLCMKYHLAQGDVWLDIMAELDERHLWYQKEIRQCFVDALTKENRYGSFFWRSPDENLFSAWQLLLKKYVIDEKKPIPYSEIRKVIKERQSVAKPIPLLTDQVDVPGLSFLLNYRIQAEHVDSLPRIGPFFELVQREYAKMTYDQLIEHVDEFFYCYWLVNYYLWDTHGEQWIAEIWGQDPDFRKTNLLMRLMGLVFHAGINVKLNNSLTALEMLKHVPGIIDSVITFFAGLSTCRETMMLSDLNSLIERINRLLSHFKIDRFPVPQLLNPMFSDHQKLAVEGSAKFKLYEEILNGSRHILFEAMPASGFLVFLKQFLMELKPGLTVSAFYKQVDPTRPVVGMGDVFDFIKHAVTVFSCERLEFDAGDLEDFLTTYYHSLIPTALALAEFPFSQEWHAIRLKILLKGQLQFKCIQPKAHKFYLSDLTELFMLHKGNNEGLLQQFVGDLVKNDQGISIIEDLINGWSDATSELSNQKTRQLGPVRKVLEEHLEKARAAKALENMEADGIEGAKKWFERLTEMVHEFNRASWVKGADLTTLLTQLEEKVDLISEKFPLRELIEHFRSFYMLYYSSETLQKERTHQSTRSLNSLKARRLILLALVSSMQMPNEMALRSYYEDVRDLFRDLIVTGSMAFELQPNVKDQFLIFMQKLCFSFRDPKVAQELFAEIYSNIPNPTLFDLPLLSIKEFALTMRIPYACYKCDIASYLRSLIGSEDPLKVLKGMHWLCGLLDPLNGDRKFREIEELLTRVFVGDGQPLKIPMEPWMISKGLSDWMLVPIDSLRSFNNQELQLPLYAIFDQYLNLYSGISELPESDQFRCYHDFMHAVATIKIQGHYPYLPSSYDFDYDSKVKSVLEKTILEYYPRKNQLDPAFAHRGFAMILIGLASTLISAMPYGLYTDEVALESKRRETVNYQKIYFTLLFSTAYHAGDRAFLEACLKACDGLQEVFKETVNPPLFFEDIKPLVVNRMQSWSVAGGRAILQQIETVNIADEFQRHVFAKEAAAIFRVWLANPPQEVTKDELSLYMKQFIQFLTQKFYDKEKIQELLKGLVEAHANSPHLNFSLKSLNTVNLCIQTNPSKYLKTPEDLVNVSRTVYRYVHSKDPVVVDTGFHWLGNLMFSLAPDAANKVLSLVFEKKRAREHKFDCSNKGEVILEPWMVSYGLSSFLMRLHPSANEAAVQEIKELFHRYIRLEQGFNDLPLEDRLRAYYKYFSLMTSLQWNRGSPLSAVMESFFWMANQLDKVTFDLFLPHRKEIEAKNLFKAGAGDVNQKIITLGTWMMECVNLSKLMPGEFLSEVYTRAFLYQTGFHQKLCTFAEENGDMKLLQTHRQTMIELQKGYANTPEHRVPYAKLIPMIDRSIELLTQTQKAGYKGAST